MFRCSDPRCPWVCGSRRFASCTERVAKRVLTAVLWAGLAGSVGAGLLSLTQRAGFE